MFVLKEDGSLIPLKPTQFVLEEHFQQLLEDHPELLAGDLIDPESPRHWLLVGREIGIPGETDGAGWWSADHLFLDQDGIPTIVEVKRQTDTRLRREVVGQMLDYAANAAAYVKVAAVRATFEGNCAKKDKDPDQELQDRLGQDIDTEKFWLQVKTNLEAQKIRLLFVADEIPRELKRVVEFLNRQMNPVEVLALELRQFSGENGLRTLVPTLYGQTEEARGAKSTLPSESNVDFTRFDLTANGTTYRNLWKRNLIRQAISEAVKAGISLEQLESILPHRSLIVVDGTLSGKAFLAAAEAKKTSDGYVFNPRRHFLDDDQLLHVEGKTCALSNQWSIVSLPLIDKIASVLPPEVKMTYTKSAG